MPIRETERFVVLDAKGRKYTIVRYQRSVPAGTFEEPDAEVDTLGEIPPPTGAPSTRP